MQYMGRSWKKKAPKRSSSSLKKDLSVAQAKEGKSDRLGYRKKQRVRKLRKERLKLLSLL